jgi:NodT family efflux transporter outer membrane factor (OMF) lipoprotein
LHENALHVTRENRHHPWWQEWDTPELHQLIDTAFHANPSLAQIAARFTQAEAAARAAGASRLPTLAWSTTGSSQEHYEPFFSTDQWSAGLAANYELDVWGRVHALQSAAISDTYTAKALYASSRMSLSAEVALSWVDLLSSRAEQRILEQQLAVNRTSLELIELRFRNGLSSALDVLQQRQVVEATAALLPLTRREEHRAHHRLNALLGRDHPLDIRTSSLPTVPATPEQGLPADLLEYRPDVQMAWHAIEAAGWRFNAARAAQFPAVRLSGRVESSDTELNRLFDNWYRTLAGSLTAPLLNRGALRADTVRAEAYLNEQVEAYRETVLLAIEEADNALMTESTQVEHLTLLTQQYQAAEQAYQEALIRYRNGAIEYTPVLLQLNSLQELERQLLRAQANQLRYRIALHRALGGRWALESPPQGEINDV